VIDFQVEQAESGERALEIIGRGPPDILLLDHKMPGISGLDVLDRVRGLQADMLTIMITAYASIETAVTATKRGAYDFLAKPFTPDELKSTVRKAATRLVLAKQARKLVEEKREVRFQFIRVLGHELQAPLNAVEGYLQMIKGQTAGDNPAAYAQMLDRSILRIEGMRKLIADLLDMTHIESGRRDRQLAPIDVREVARAAMETLSSSAAARNITLHLEPDAPLTMVADRGEIEMIFNNLLSNAIKYNRDGGRVEIAIGRQPEQVVIRVSDTGIGMTAEEAARLFGEFVRIRNEKTQNVLGSGLGLSIVKKIALLYGGDATVQSRPDAGSTFTVVLHEAAGAASKPSSPAAGAADE
jgi:signal transduction histidine kinase